MVDYTETVNERITRKMNYFKEHKQDMKPRIITIKVEKKENMFSKEMKSCDDLAW